MAKNPRVESPCWDYFSPKPDQPWIAVCRLNGCEHEAKRGKHTDDKAKYSLKALWNHLKAEHPAEAASAEEIKESNKQKKIKRDEAEQKRHDIYKLTTAGESKPKQQISLMSHLLAVASKKWTAKDKAQQESISALVNWMADSIQPYSVVQNKLFKLFIEGLNPKFNLPSEKMLRQSIFPSCYKKLQWHIKSLLDKHMIDGIYSITTDIWSSKSSDSYLGVTCHFLDKDFVQKMVVLRCFPYNASHTVKC